MRRLLLLLFLTSTLVGCGSERATTPPATPAPPPATEVFEAAESQPVPPGAPSPAEMPTPAPDTTLQPAAGDPPTIGVGGDSVAKPPATDPARHRERIAVLTAGGPLIVDVWITVDGQAHVDRFDSRLQAVIKASDTNHDQQATWRELAANDEFLKAERATAPNSADERAKAWLERFDLNRDKRIQPDEAAAWLGRDAGRTAAALSMRSKRAYHAIPALASRVWQLVDGDKNSRLSADEISSVPDRFLSFDGNDDRIITPQELAPLREQLNGPGMQMQMPSLDSNDTRYAALQLGPDRDVDQLNYLLSDLYSPLQNLGPGSFTALPRLFDDLDADGDLRLDRQELARFSTIEPHLELAITFERPIAENKRRPARLEIRRHSPELAAPAQPAENRMVVSLSGSQITFSAHDLATPQAAANKGEHDEIRAMVHDDNDAVFAALDRNADGRLGEQEITSARARLSERDTNGDGELAGDELPASMIVAFLRGEPPEEQSFYVPEAAATSGRDAPAWFTAADFNSDGDVSRREFLGSIEQFLELDEDQDGFIEVAEARPTIEPAAQASESNK